MFGVGVSVLCVCLVCVTGCVFGGCECAVCLGVSVGGTYQGYVT